MIQGIQEPQGQARLRDTLDINSEEKKAEEKKKGRNDECIVTESKILEE